MKKKLNITHINTHDAIGGAAKVAFRLTKDQNENGHFSNLLVGVKNSQENFTYEFTRKIDVKKVELQNLLYYEFQGSHKLIENWFIRNSDIINFHNLHGSFFNPFSIFLLSNYKPSIWTLHDMQAITGHCSHSLDCTKYETDCFNCSYLDTYPKLKYDNASLLLKHKEFIYRNSFLKIICPSVWLKSKVEKSILKDFNSELIYNSVDTEVFKPIDKITVRKKYGIPEDIIIIGNVAQAGISNPWKGSKYALNVINRITETRDDVVFVNVGSNEENTHPKIFNVPHVDDENQLAEIFSLMDIFLFTSIAENCPLVILEALSCGTPIVSFATGGVPELVRNNVDGMIVEYCNEKQMISALNDLINNKELQKKYSYNSRKRAFNEFDKRIINRIYEENYYECIDEFNRNKVELDPNIIYSLPNEIRTETFIGSFEKLPTLISENKNHEKYPKISVVTPSYNQGKFIERTIRSVINQGYPNLEYIIIDGGSTDDSVDIIRKYEDNLDYWVSEKDSGQSNAINKGLEKATGDIFIWMNSDDYFQPNAFFSVAEAYNKNPNAIGWIGGCNVLNENYDLKFSIFPNGLEFEHIANNWNGRQFFPPSCFLNLPLVKEVGALNEELHYCMDLDLYLRLLKQGEFMIGDGIWANALSHSEAKTFKLLDNAYSEVIKYQNENGFAKGAENRYNRRFNSAKLEFEVSEEYKKRFLEKYDLDSLNHVEKESKNFYEREHILSIIDSKNENVLDELVLFVKNSLNFIKKKYPNIEMHLYVDRLDEKLEDFNKLNVFKIFPIDQLDKKNYKLAVTYSFSKKHELFDYCISNFVPIVDFGNELNEAEDGKHVFKAKSYLELSSKVIQLLNDATTWGWLTFNNFVFNNRNLLIDFQKEDLVEKEFFDKIDRDFINIELTKDNIDKYWIRRSIKKSIDEILPNLQGTLVDLGCGIMPYKNYILKNQPEVNNYIGIDINNPSYQSQIIPDKFWDGKTIPLEEDYADNIIALELFEHLPDLSSVLTEIHRILKKGGLLFFTVPFVWPLHDVPNDEFRYTPFSLNRLLEKAGFKSIEIKTNGGWNASLAQMMALWLKRSPENFELKKEVNDLFLKIYKILIDTDLPPNEFKSQTIFPSLYGIARKL